LNRIIDTDNFVALLGTKGGPAIRQGSTNPTSSLLVLDGRPIIIDCGLGVTRAVVDQGMALKNLGLIFITHMHSDHYLELGPLLHTAWTAGLSNPVIIYGPEDIKDYLQSFLKSMQADIDLRIKDEGRPDLTKLIFFKKLDEGEVLNQGGMTVSAIKNEHPPLIDTFALKFENVRHSVVFSGDTAYFPPLAEFAKNTDLLIHETMLENALEALFKRVGNGDDRLMKHLLRSHTKAEDVARIATQAKVKALALYHLIPSDDPDFSNDDWLNAIQPHWDGTLHIGTDGMRIEL